MEIEDYSYEEKKALDEAWEIMQKRAGGVRFTSHRSRRFGRSGIGTF